jgi:hypothetical protein
MPMNTEEIVKKLDDEIKPLLLRAADVIEQRAARIAELEEELEATRRTCFDHHRRLGQLENAPPKNRS